MGIGTRRLCALSVAGWLGLSTPAASAEPERARAAIHLDGAPVEASSRSTGGWVLLHHGTGSQAAVLGVSEGFLADLAAGGRLEVHLTGGWSTAGGRLSVRVEVQGANPARVVFGAGAGSGELTVEPGKSVGLSVNIAPGAAVPLTARGVGDAECVVACRDFRFAAGGEETGRSVALEVAAGDPGRFPPPETPAPRPAIEQALIEWDWRLQDGLGTAREPGTFAAAIGATLARGDALLADLRSRGVNLGAWPADWERLRARSRGLAPQGGPEGPAGEALWREVHALRRRLSLANPLVPTGPIAFVKHVPSMFSHQLTQYTGNCARPGGGLFVLEAPGRSMQVRRLDAGLPPGSFEFADVSPDGRRVLFSFCAVDRVPPDRVANRDRTFHLYEAAVDGSTVRQLTDGPYDDFAGRYLPDGRIVFVSTRRGGYHRCGQGPCPVHTLALCNADGSDPRPISYHETQEWDPCVLNDGRVIYTRWDYVDRNAVHYQHLWTARPDGSDVRAYYGNHTLNPVGLWEARPIPGSTRVMATAGAHHAMTAGSIVLVDVTRGIDGLAPLTRLTPDVLFPESEAPVARLGPGGWHSPAVVESMPPTPTEAARWPGHVYKSPYPLSETSFLASYSFEPLIGEPDANVPNGFGLYLVDAFGNRELLYRDPNVSSLWAMPLAPRPRPPVVVEVASAGTANEGVFFLQDVHRSWPQLDPGAVKRLRIVQVLPKTTWHANQPTLGLPSISPGKQVLGTVPVEPDGSACFRAPARIPLSFQALDAGGQALQTMRSLTYLQPGETSSCVGCHEHRETGPALGPGALALRRAPSTIRPGPDGSNPLSYPILVQPVLDRLCVSCHSRAKPEGGIVLSGEPEGRYTASYNALAPRTSYADWAGRPGDFRVINSEPLTRPGFFGARGSKLMTLLREGHQGVTLAPDDVERLATWMDANALFYGTFDPEDQARQQRGERIAGPKLR